MTAARSITAIKDERHVPNKAAATIKSQRSYLNIPPTDYLWAFGFLLTQSLTGLAFYPSVLIALFMMIVAYRSRPYDLSIMLVFWAGGYTITRGGYLGSMTALLLLAVISLVIVRKWPMFKRVLWVFLGYFAFMLVIALLSDESLKVQLVMMRPYVSVSYFLVPILIFANRKFDFEELKRKIFTYAICIAMMYVIDCYLLCGHVMFPYAGFLDPEEMAKYNPSWTNPDISLLAFSFPRIGPFPMIFFILLIFPLVKSVKLRTWQWVLVVLMLIACRSATLLIAFVTTFVIFKARGKKLVLYLAGVVVGVMALSAIDDAVDGELRVNSTISQFAILKANVSDEELAEFGTGRMAQFIPKFALLQSYNREWIGFGFLDPTKSTAHKYMISNALYDSVWDIDEVATGVEITQLQTILDMGYLGLIVQTLVYFGLYFVIRKQKYAKYYLCTIVCASISGLGGNGGLYLPYSLLPIGLLLGGILLANKPQREAVAPQPLP